jgi:putative ABC transport system ATP-binding protein
MALIKLEKVSKVYHTNDIEFPALRDISFEVKEGEFLSIAGPSGSGKTTLLNIIGCLDVASSGSVELQGKNIGQRTSNELADIRRQTIGFVFQTFNLIPILSAFENVEFPLLLCNSRSASERRDMVEEMLGFVGLKDFMSRKPSELSGGQQQRVAIARALVKKPSLVLADEPTANLDSKTGNEILDLMRDLNQKTGTTFVFSTHDNMVMEYATRLINLRDGIIESDESRR